MTTRSVDLAVLVAKLEAATRPDRLLDAELWDLIDPRPRCPMGAEPPIYKQDEDEEVLFDCAPEYTANLNLACALLQKIFPGRQADLTLKFDLAHCEIILWHPDDLLPADREALDAAPSPKTVFAKGPAALALCRAIVKALIAEKEAAVLAA
jgi:hypothetical protein